MDKTVIHLKYKEPHYYPSTFDDTLLFAHIYPAEFGRGLFHKSWFDSFVRMARVHGWKMVVDDGAN